MVQFSIHDAKLADVETAKLELACSIVCVVVLWLQFRSQSGRATFAVDWNGFFETIEWVVRSYRWRNGRLYGRLRASPRGDRRLI